MIPLRKKTHLVGAFIGAICFFLVVPFGIIFGVLHRLIGGTHRKKDRAF